MDNLQAVESLGFTLPSPAYIFGVILFSILGFAAYRYGKNISSPRAKWIGITLMLYPYGVPQTWLLYVVGVGLCAALYWFRD